jgi:hypothetical protein
MLLDVLSLITPDPSIIQTQGLQGSTPSWTFVSPANSNNLQDLVYIKGQNVNPAIPGGYPWDWLTVGRDFIYQRLTENVWSDPSTGKLMFGLGSPRFLRYIDYSPNQPPGKWSFTVTRPQTDYVIYGPATGQPSTPYGWPVSRSSDALVRNSFSGPFPAAANGQLPAGEDWLAEYEWGGKVVSGVTQYSTIERIFHRTTWVSGSRFGYGRYQWIAYAWRSDGDYSQATPIASSLANKFLMKPCPTPVQLIF